MAAQIASQIQAIVSTGGIGSIPGIGNLAKSVPTLEGALGGAQGSIADFITKGTPIGQTSLLIIALIPFIGSFGINLIAGGSTMWAAAKFAFQGFCTFLSGYLKLYYPMLWPIAAILTYLNPWYTFDILQAMSPAFAKEGFKLPFTSAKTIAAEGGVGKFNGIVLGMSVTALSLGGFAIINWLPPELVGSVKPLLQTIFLAIAGVTAAAGGGIGAYVLLPQIISKFKQSASDTVSTTPATASAAVPAATTTAAPTPTVPTSQLPMQQLGGGGTGGSMPNLRQIADGMLGPNPAGDQERYHSAIQSGGARRQRPKTDSDLTTIFLGGLAALSLLGITSAVYQNKTQPAAKVE